MAESMRKQLSYTAAEIDERLAKTDDIENKVDKETGKGLSTNDYTTSEKEKLGGLSGEDVFVLGTSLSSNSDLNSLTTPDKWYATTAAIATSISNIPADVTSAFFGVTIPSVAGSRYIQILVPNDDTGVWYKRRYTGSWQAWVKYKPDPTTQLSENVDLDTLTTEGIWYGYNAVGSSAQHLPVPNGNYNIRVENVMIGAVYLKQICTIARMQNVCSEFVRVKNISSGGAWQPWEMVAAVGEMGWDLVKNDDLNDFLTVGTYQAQNFTISSSIVHSPETVQPFRLDVKYLNSRTNVIQELTTFDSSTYETIVYRRLKTSAGFQPWRKFVGAVI